MIDTYNKVGRPDQIIVLMEGYLLESSQHTPEEQLGDDRIALSITDDGDAQHLSNEPAVHPGYDKRYVVHEDGRRFRKVQLEGVEGTFLLDENTNDIYDEHYALVKNITD